MGMGMGNGYGMGMGNGYGYGYGYGYGMGTGADPGILEGGSKIKFMKGEGTGGGVHESSFGKYTRTIVSCMLFTLLWYPPVINATPLCAPEASTGSPVATSG